MPHPKDHAAGLARACRVPMSALGRLRASCAGLSVMSGACFDVAPDEAPRTAEPVPGTRRGRRGRRGDRASEAAASTTRGDGETRRLTAARSDSGGGARRCVHSPAPPNARKPATSQPSTPRCAHSDDRATAEGAAASYAGVSAPLSRASFAPKRRSDAPDKAHPAAATARASTAAAQETWPACSG